MRVALGVLVGILWLPVALSVALSMARADEVYKSVDADGHVVYSDRPDPTASQSAAVQITPARIETPGDPPPELHFCWTNCFTLSLRNGVYRRSDGADESWTVERFSAQGIVLHRHDAPAEWNGYSDDVIYAGQASNDRLTGVTVNGKPVSGIDISWNAALYTLPGSNAERDARNGVDSIAPTEPVNSTSAPPVLPEEDQPELPHDGYLWIPGYWYWRDRGYVWIPGVWRHPPRTGILWTPPYWSAAGAGFVFHPGHWGATVGYYGGVNYGHGYSGNGYSGGHWVGNSFAYDSGLNHLSPAVAHRAYAESSPSARARGATGIAAGPNVGSAPQHGPVVRAANRTPAPVIQGTGEPTPKAAEPERPAAAARQPASGARAKVNPVAQTGTVSAKK